MDVQPEYRDFRPGDVRHSLADISRARQSIGYEPQFSVTHGLDMAAAWYMERGFEKVNQINQKHGEQTC